MDPNVSESVHSHQEGDDSGDSSFPDPAEIILVPSPHRSSSGLYVEARNGHRRYFRILESSREDTLPALIHKAEKAEACGDDVYFQSASLYEKRDGYRPGPI